MPEEQGKPAGQNRPPQDRPPQGGGRPRVVAIADRVPVATVADVPAEIAAVTVVIAETAAAVSMARPRSIWINS